MGSYLTIVNNTPDKWHCRVSADEAALNMVKVVTSSFSKVVGTIGGAVSKIPIPGAEPVMIGISIGAAVVSTVAISASAATDFVIDVVHGINDNLVNKGFVAIDAGARHQWPKMTLALWQQGVCVRTYNVEGTLTVRTETVYMRPIFSGLTADSNIDHDIQWWINKNGVETQDVAGEQPRKLEEVSGGFKSTEPLEGESNVVSIFPQGE